MKPHVSQLWRYPVKSLRGQPLAEADVRLDGFVGDRLVHVREPNGRVVTSRYRPGLLALPASLGADGEPLIAGRPWRDEASLEAVRAASAPDVDLVRFAEPDTGHSNHGGRRADHHPTGHDVINARNGRRDLVDCGTGFDSALVDPRDSVRRCERVRRARR